MIKTKKQLIRAFEDYIISRGATLINPSMGICGEYCMDTRAGMMNITLFDTWVALRFKDIDKAKTIVSDMNNFSGKWNIQYMDLKNYTCISDFRMALFGEVKNKIEFIH